MLVSLHLLQNGPMGKLLEAYINQFENQKLIRKGPARNEDNQNQKCGGQKSKPTVTSPFGL